MTDRMVRIPAGEFEMGNPFISESDDDERPVHTVYVDEFYMDVTQVTNEMYKAFEKTCYHTLIERC